MLFYIFMFFKVLGHSYLFFTLFFIFLNFFNNKYKGNF